MARGTRIHPLVPALLALVVVGVLVLVVARAVDDDKVAAPMPTVSPSSTTTAPPTTSTPTTVPEPYTVEELAVPGPEVDAPRAYRITYDVVENGLPRTEEWTVRRPYESLVLGRRDGALLTGTSTSRAVLQTYLSDRDGWLPVQPELHRAAFDQHPAGAVGAMEVLGLVERRGTEEHLGRSCTVYRTGQPPSAGEATPPSDGEHTDVCIDGSGLVLHEVWEIGGSVVIERTASALELEPEIDPAVFEPGPLVEDADAVSQLFSTIAVKADEETLDRLKADVPVPEGYTDDGAVFRAAQGGAGPGGAASSGSAEVVRFYSSGPSLLEVSEVFVDGDADLSDAAVPVEVDRWGEVWFEPGFRVSSLRGRTSDSSYVELRHHDVAFLFEVLASIQRAE